MEAADDNMQNFQNRAMEASVSGALSSPCKLNTLLTRNPKGVTEIEHCRNSDVVPHVENFASSVFYVKYFCRRRARLFVPAAQNRNNHTEMVLIKSLLGPLALSSYWLTLTS